MTASSSEADGDIAVVNICALLPVAVGAEQLQVVDGRGATAGNRYEGAAAVDALPAVALEYDAPDLAGNGFAAHPAPCLRADGLVEVEHQVGPVQFLLGPPLPVPDQGEHVTER